MRTRIFRRGADDLPARFLAAKRERSLIIQGFSSSALCCLSAMGISAFFSGVGRRLAVSLLIWRLASPIRVEFEQSGRIVLARLVRVESEQPERSVVTLLTVESSEGEASRLRVGVLSPLEQNEVDELPSDEARSESDTPEIEEQSERVIGT